MTDRTLLSFATHFTLLPAHISFLGFLVHTAQASPKQRTEILKRKKPKAPSYARVKARLRRKIKVRVQLQTLPEWIHDFKCMPHLIWRCRKMRTGSHDRHSFH